MLCGCINIKWRQRAPIRPQLAALSVRKGAEEGIQCNESDSRVISPKNPDYQYHVGQPKEHDTAAHTEKTMAFSIAIGNAEIGHGRRVDQAQQGESSVSRDMESLLKLRRLSLFKEGRFDRSGALSPSERSRSSKEGTVLEREAVMEPSIEWPFQALSSIDSNSTYRSAKFSS
jgi:hypothetical protein